MDFLILRMYVISPVKQERFLKIREDNASTGCKQSKRRKLLKKPRIQTKRPSEALKAQESI